MEVAPPPPHVVNYKEVLADTWFIKTRLIECVTALKMFESDIGISCLAQEEHDGIQFNLKWQKSLVPDPVSEILDGLTETFTLHEKKHFNAKSYCSC